MAAVPTYLVADLVATVRSDSDLNQSQVYTDAQIAGILSDAGSDLQDLFTGANQHYNVSQFAFTLVGGVGQNSVTLPADFQQGHSVDVNPGTAQPYTLRYLPNWLDRNRFSNGPFTVFGPGGGPREYYILSSSPATLYVLPAMGAAGNFLLYYTPTWTPLALPATVQVNSATINLPPNGTTVGFSGSPVNFVAASAVFLATDVGNEISVEGAVNAANNGVVAITSFVIPAQVAVASGPVAEILPVSATAVLIRASRVDSAGNWTLYGESATGNTTLVANVGDSLVVSGTQHNNGTFTVTSGSNGGVSVSTSGTTVAENFAPGVSVQVVRVGTVAALPTFMNPWVLYLKTIACITIRNKRGQDVESFMARLQIQQQRIEKILQDRVEEPQQPPMTRNSGFWDF